MSTSSSAPAGTDTGSHEPVGSPAGTANAAMLNTAAASHDLRDLVLG